MLLHQAVPTPLFGVTPMTPELDVINNLEEEKPISGRLTGSMGWVNLNAAFRRGSASL